MIPGKESHIMSAITITKNNFSTEVMSSDKPVLLDFWASWCAPCRLISSTIEEISNEAPYAKVGKIDVDEQPELAGMFRIQSIPSLVVMKGGKAVNMMVGVRSKTDILQMLSSMVE